MKTQASAISLLKKMKFESDYNKFAFLQSNRIVDPKHTEKMVKSLRMMGIIRPVVVIETDFIDGVMRKYIVDGQHLFYACMRENIEVPYIVIDVKDNMNLIYKMAMLNNSSKSWDLMNYIVAYKAVNVDYQRLFDLKMKYNLEILMIAAIGKNVISSKINGGEISTIIKEGSYIFNNDNAEKMAKDFSDIFIAVGPSDRWVKYNFLSQFMINYGAYDHKKTITNIKKNIAAIKAMTDVVYAREYIQNNIFIMK